MATRCEKGDWVEVHQVVLPAQDRSRDVPEDTRKVPLEAWIKGWAQSAASEGDVVDIVTPAGRVVTGTLTKVDPGYTHTYGPSVPELASIARELRAALKGGGERG